MCDIADIKCEGCGMPVNTHIGDFSAARENVHPFCPRATCRAKALAFLLGARGKFERGGKFMVFSNAPACAKDVCPAPIWPEGKAFIFIVDIPHRIETNG